MASDRSCLQAIILLARYVCLIFIVASILLFIILIYENYEPINVVSIIKGKSVGSTNVKTHVRRAMRHNTSGHLKPSRRLVEMYRRQAPRRQHYLAKTDGGYARIYNNMAPEVYCSELVKVGSTDDGGKWMCGPFDLPENCTIFSLGMAGDISFEEDIQMLTQRRCKVYSFDTAQQSPNTTKRLKAIGGQAMAVNIVKESNPDNSEYSLHDLMGMHMVDEIEVLKIDIEGSEWSVMEDFLSKHQVSQIMIEVHRDPSETLKLLRMISRKGYLLFNYEINGEYHILCEYSFIHESVLDLYGATLLAKYLN